MILALGGLVCVTLLLPAASRAEAYVAAVTADLPPVQRAVLQRIPDRARRNLAAAEYLRRGPDLDSLWAWSAAEARAYQASEEYRVLMHQVRRVREEFARRNPGFGLVTDTVPRGLATQLRYWNREPSVALAAWELGDSIRTWLDGPGDRPEPDSAALQRLRTRMRGYTPATPPTVAVPGLSRHGRLRAFDFAVVSGRRIVAGTLTATMDSVWDRGGWTERLREAVAAAGGAFAGPLAQPREPWHYEHRGGLR